MTTFTDVFGGATIRPSQVSFREFTIAANTSLTSPGELSNGTDVAADIMSVTASSGSLTLRLPPGSEVGAGTPYLVKNAGANTFTLATSAGTTVASIASGEAWYVWCVDNSTTAGTWDAIEFGTGTSAASAAALAGAGLTALGSLLAQDAQIDTFNSNYTAGTGDRARALVWIGGSGTLALPVASTVGEGWFCYVRNSGSGTLTIDPDGAVTIDDSSSLVMNPGESLILITDGTEYYSIGYGRDAAYAFTLQSIDISGTGDYTLSAVQQNKTVYTLTGLLTGNRNLIVPTTAQQYWVANDTTGAFTLTVKTAAGSGVTVIQGQRAILYCDGTNVLDADTAGISTPVAIADGGTGATTASAARTNLGGTSVGVNVFTAASAAAARSAIGSTAVGDAIFIAGTAGSARGTLGSTAVGDALFTAVDAAAARTTLGLGSLATLSTIVSANITDGTIATADLGNDQVTYAKIQNVATNQRVLGRTSGAGGDVEELATSTILDWLGSTRGSILYRGASGWTILTPSTAGRVLTDNGVGADPTFSAVTLPAGTIIDRAFASYTAVTLITGITPWDDSIPQIGEGTEILSASITPKSATNRIRIRAQVFGARASGGDLSHSMHAHVNGGAAIAAVGMSLYDNNATLWPGILEWEYVPGSTSAQTITIRVGSATSTGFYLNGNSTGRKYGGVGACTLVLEEIKV